MRLFNQIIFGNHSAFGVIHISTPTLLLWPYTTALTARRCVFLSEGWFIVQLPGPPVRLLFKIGDPQNVSFQISLFFKPPFPGTAPPSGGGVLDPGRTLPGLKSLSPVFLCRSGDTRPLHPQCRTPWARPPPGGCPPDRCGHPIPLTARSFTSRAQVFGSEVFSSGPFLWVFDRPFDWSAGEWQVGVGEPRAATVLFSCSPNVFAVIFIQFLYCIFDHMGYERALKRCSTRTSPNPRK